MQLTHRRSASTQLGMRLDRQRLRSDARVCGLSVVLGTATLFLPEHTSSGVQQLQHAASAAGANCKSEKANRIDALIGLTFSATREQLTQIHTPRVAAEHDNCPSNNTTITELVLRMTVRQF